MSYELTEAQARDILRREGSLAANVKEYDAVETEGGFWFRRRQTSAGIIGAFPRVVSHNGRTGTVRLGETPESAIARISGSL